MVAFRTAEGTEVDLACGDDVEVAVLDPLVEGGLRVLTGQVTSVRAGEPAVWVRGVRVDVDSATVLRRIPSESPDNLTPPPVVCDPGSAAGAARSTR
jgi:hypothetical protein